MKFLSQNDYWHGAQAKGAYYRLDKVAGYYNDLTKKVSNDAIEIDVLIPKVNVKNKLYIHPVTVCQVGLGAYDLFLSTHDNIRKKQFLSCCQWLLKHSVLDSFGGASWKVPYAFKLFSQPAFFHSGLIQGQAISLLIRAFITTEEDKYLALAKKAYVFMTRSVEEGGTYNSRVGMIEEYPIPGENHIVLNGAISALWGVMDLALATKEEAHLTKYTFLLDALIENLSSFDAGYYSRYCIYSRWFFSNVSSPYYHREHIEQLDILKEMSSDDRILKIMDQFRNYEVKSTNGAIATVIKGLYLLIQKLLRLR